MNGIGDEGEEIWLATMKLPVAAVSNTRNDACISPPEAIRLLMKDKAADLSAYRCHDVEQL